MNDSEIPPHIQVSATAGECTMAYYLTLRRMGMGRRDALKLTGVWVATSAQNREQSELVLHGRN